VKQNPGLVDANIIGIFIVDQRNWIIEANEAFSVWWDTNRNDSTRGAVRWTDTDATRVAPTAIASYAELRVVGKANLREGVPPQRTDSRCPRLIGSAQFGRRWKLRCRFSARSDRSARSNNEALHELQAELAAR